MTTREDLLASIPLFSSCPPRVLHHLAHLAEGIEVAGGVTVIRERGRDRHFYVIADGRALVTRRGQAVAVLGPGAWFGELAPLTHAERNATVTALTDLSVVVFGEREFLGILDVAPSVARKLLGGLAERLREADAVYSG